MSSYDEWSIISCVITEKILSPILINVIVHKTGVTLPEIALNVNHASYS